MAGRGIVVKQCKKADGRPSTRVEEARQTPPRAVSRNISMARMPTKPISSATRSARAVASALTASATAAGATTKRTTFPRGSKTHSVGAYLRV